MTSNSPFEKSLHTDIRNAVGNDFDLGIDDYFQYAPIAEMYLADIWGQNLKTTGLIKPKIYCLQI